MQFDVFLVRREGKLLPRHVMWATKVRGDLWITEERDAELHRTVRIERIRNAAGYGTKDLVPPLLDVVFLSAKPDWWTMTGWERVDEAAAGRQRAYQQSWILVPEDKA